MTTDKQLKMLEAAAKACGVHIDYSTTNGGGAGNTGFDIIGNVVTNWNDGDTWNPLTSSADCAAMCAKLEIDTFWRKTAVSCSQRGRIGVCTITHNGTQEEKKTAWRSAATMVAAKIGGMK